MAGYPKNYETVKIALPHGDRVLCIKRQGFGVFQKKKKCEHEEQKQLLKATTSSRGASLRASFLVAKTMRSFTIGEELIMPAAKDICHEL